MITITRDGESYGPYDSATIESMLTSGQVTLSDHAWRDGEADWRPLGDLIGRRASAPPPLPSVIAENPNAEKMIFQEQNITVTNKQIIINSQIFVVKNIGGVTIQKEPARTGVAVTLIVLGVLGLLILFPLFFLDEARAVAIFAYLMLGVMIWFAFRFIKNAKPLLIIGLTAAGGFQKAFMSKDQEFVDRVVAAIQKAIL